MKNITVTQIDTQTTSLEIALQYPYVGDGYSKSKTTMDRDNGVDGW